MRSLHLKYNYSTLEGILPITWGIKSLFCISNSTTQALKRKSGHFSGEIKVHSVPQIQLLNPREKNLGITRDKEVLPISGE